MSFFTVLISSKIALGVLGVAAVAAGGTAAVAVAGNLPEASQGIVHADSAKPDPTKSAKADTADSTDGPDSTSASKGPDAKGAAAFGLCNAFTHGGLGTKSTAYGSLVTAASGAEKVATYCATVIADKKSASHRSTDTSSKSKDTTSESENTTSESEDTTSDESVALAAPVLPSQAATGADHKKTSRP
ncbi:hypothetical protein [Frigoribacterium sp. CG_9.8]|uniref:hypothetical protein n=1 Tax=Frigoribacterium sp. CG_9.8 TaxID=2787733 RepID=UPI0018CA7730|nr:hypothetical protein [Frigoribacterium sp. CG_9.8]MBG6108431.1 hypothetical protein [Frigoribacterium sp. CG_9.8]